MHHDPRQAAGLLRDHLASHDRRLAFLFGAGVSASINIAPPPAPGERLAYEPLIPAVDQLTDACRKETVALGADFESAWTNLSAELESLGLPPNVENVLTRLRLKIDSAGPSDKPLGLSLGDLRAMEKVVRETIVRSVTLEDSAIPPSTPHDGFARWARQAIRNHPLEVFTLNYDLLLERALERVLVPCFDGFVGCYRPFFSSELIEDQGRLPGPETVRLWKIHGSVNWCEVKIDGTTRIVRCETDESNALILPSYRKYEESRKQPYLALLDRLSRVLRADNTVLVVIGYSFRDQHVNAAILDGLTANPSAHTIALEFANVDRNSALVTMAEQHANLIVYAKNAGVVSCQYGEWRLREAVNDQTAHFMDAFFDSRAAPEDDAEAREGLATIGDFNRFTHFLEMMERDHVAS